MGQSEGTSMTLLLLGLASYNFTRIIAVSRFPLAENLRYKVYYRFGNESWQYYLVNCVWCVGVYISAVVVGITSFFADLPLPVLWWGAVAGFVGIIHTIVKVAETWSAKIASELESLP